MSSSTTLTDAAGAYLEAVRGALSDLPEDELEEILGDLAVQLADLEPADTAEVSAALGDPRRFAAELREAAGIGEEAPEVKGLGHALRAHLDAVRRRPGALWVSAQLRRARPYWLAVRGWLLVASISVIYNRFPFINFPVPEVVDSAWFGAVIVVGLTWLSLRLGRARRSGKVFDKAFTVATLFYVAVAFAGNFPLQQAQELPYDLHRPTYWGLLGANGPITNIYAYDLDGNAVQVLLYDQEGRPISVRPDLELRYAAEMGVITDDRLVLYEDGRDIAIPLDDQGNPIPNLYPLDIRTRVYRGTGAVESTPITPPTTISIPGG